MGGNELEGGGVVGTTQGWEMNNKSQMEISTNTKHLRCEGSEGGEC